MTRSFSAPSLKGAPRPTEALALPPDFQAPWFNEPRPRSMRSERALRSAASTTRDDEIADEIEREVEVIRRRYAGPQHRLFPAAVTFIVPEGNARSLVR